MSKVTREKMTKRPLFSENLPYKLYSNDQLWEWVKLVLKHMKHNVSNVSNETFRRILVKQEIIGCPCSEAGAADELNRAGSAGRRGGPRSVSSGNTEV